DDDDDDSDGVGNIEETGGLIDVDTPALRAIKFLEDELDFPPPLRPPPSSSSSSHLTLSLQKTSVFLAHGSLDDKVPIDVGMQGRDCLRALGTWTEWMEEEGQGHWYSGKMLERLIAFLEECRVVEVARGHSGMQSQSSSTTAGEEPTKKCNMLDGQGEDRDVDDTLRKFALTVGGVAEKVEHRTGKE
ncbi:hypothetical protein MMC31_001958, partial [Peltigera leucophlebia]|nr:hypothetical protein [Peltigera leucophlebia]